MLAADISRSSFECHCCQKAVDLRPLSKKSIIKFSMNTLRNIATIFFLLFFASLQAQVKYGFKTGLNFAKMSGPSELDNAGMSLESWKNVVGFHIGVSFSNKFTDNFGVRGEFLYSKKGAEYKYDGQSYRFFNPSGGTVYSTGNAKYLINISNAYLDLPVIAFYRAGDFEFSAGGYVGVMVQATGEGSLVYSDGKTQVNNQPIAETEFFLNYNYRKDDPGGASGDEMQIVRVDNQNLELPKSFGAYYDYPAGSSRLFNALDYGLVGGVSYFLSNSLYLSARVQYGLADITNNKADIQKASTAADKSLIYRSDKDKNFVIQASVGFSF